MNKFEHMTNDYVRQNYVPAVYQPNIYAIDYQKLKNAGIKLISFDVDDTIAGLLAPHPPKEAITLFANLKHMGFELMLLSNAKKKRVKHFANKLGIDDQYIANARKPLTKHFEEMRDRFGVEKSQMAHTGNSIIDDVAGGDAYGITTCLVRRAGNAGKFVDSILTPQGKELRKELEKRGLWRKHRLYSANDQYYQLGETPAYMSHKQAEGYKRAMQSQEQQIVKSLKDSTILNP